MKRSTVIWLVVFLFGALGLVLNGVLRPHGFSTQYVREKEVEFVQVDVGVPIGADANEAADSKAKPKWLKSTESELHLPNVHRTSAAPIKWMEEETVTPVVAWREMATPKSGISISWANTIGVWVAALFTLAVLSFLWRDNPIYKFTESVIVGVSAAYWMMNAFWETLVPSLAGELLPGIVQRWALPGTSGEYGEWWWVTLFPLVLSVMLLLRLSRRAGWIASWPLAFVIGTTAGMKLVNQVEADFFKQVSASVIPVVATDSNGKFDWGSSVGNVTLIVSLVTVLVYFFFSVEHKGAVGKVARLGIWFLMVSFGAAFAFTVMGRITLLSQRIEFLFNDWLWVIDPMKEHTVTAVKAAGVLVLSLM